MRRLLLLLLMLAVPVAAQGTIVTPQVVLVDPTTDLQSAVNNLDATVGGELRLGPGTYQLSSTLRLDRPVKLYGAGQYATHVEMDNPDSTIIEVMVGGTYIRDLTVNVASGAVGAGDGVGILVRNPGATPIRDNIFEDMSVYSTGSWGIRICGTSALEAPFASTGDIVAPQFNHVTVYNQQSGGAVYSGMGVAAPHFSDCGFVAEGFWPAGTGSWRWHDVIPAYYDYPDTTALPLGSVYLFGSTASVFRNCSFELNGTADTPVISLEDNLMSRFEGCHFEVSNPRAHPLVTISASSGWVFRDTYVYAPADAPLKFLMTNTNPDSKCSGMIDGFTALHGSTSSSVDTSDFRFNTVDGKSRNADGESDGIVLRDVHIYNTHGRGFRDVSVLQGSGTSAFPSQNLLLQNTSRRFAIPKVSSDSLSDLAGLKRGELVYAGGKNSGAPLAGGLGRLLLVADHSALTPIPTIPQAADTATVRGYYTSAGTTPREGDLCYTTGDHKLKVYTGSVWEALH